MKILTGTRTLKIFLTQLICVIWGILNYCVADQVTSHNSNNKLLASSCKSLKLGTQLALESQVADWSLQLCIIQRHSYPLRINLILGLSNIQQEKNVRKVQSLICKCNVNIGSPQLCHFHIPWKYLDVKPRWMQLQIAIFNF